MKYLSDYIKDEQSSLLKELGAFFAFSDEQFKEGVAENKHLKPEGTKWASVGAGMYMPSVNVDEFVGRHAETVKAGMKRDLTENGRSGVLSREIGNYEVTYTGDVNDPNFRDALDGYGFTEEEIQHEFKLAMERDY